MSTDRQMNFRRVLRALREQEELKQILGARPGESLVDAAKRIRSRITDDEPILENHEPKETIATIQIVADDRYLVAGILHCLAERIKREGFFEHSEGMTFASVRPSAGNDDGECAIDAGVFWGVGYAESFPGEEIAFFANKNTAVRFSQGKPVFDEDEGLQPPSDGDLCVVRAQLVGSIWNSTEPEPGAKQ